MFQQERELVKIVSNNPAHPAGYYTQFKDQMKPGDVIFNEESTPEKIKLPKPIIKQTPKKRNRK